MLIIPAIDIIERQVVRLYEGEFDQTTIFSVDPVDVARRWLEAGATWLHIVDLDGARAGRPVNAGLILQIRQATGLRVQVGGGLRALEDIASLLAHGVERVVLGTAAVRNPALVRDLAEIYGERIVVALDARDDLVVTDGRSTSSGRSAVALAEELAAAGVQHLIYTDIVRNEQGTGPNYAGLAALRRAIGPDVNLIASGGIATLDQLQRLRDLGLTAAIVGRAIYTGDLSLAAAIRAVA